MSSALRDPKAHLGLVTRRQLFVWQMCHNAMPSALTSSAVDEQLSELLTRQEAKQQETHLLLRLPRLCMPLRSGFRQLIEL